MTAIIDEIMRLVPEQKRISDTSFEGANIILYTKDAEFFLNNQGLIKTVVDSIKKRVELRPDPAITMDIEKAEKKIREIIPKEAEIGELLFDPQRSRVIIEVDKPGLAIGREGEVLKEVRKQCLWVPVVRRTPPLRSKIIENIRAVLYQHSDERRKFLDKVGHRIYDGWMRGKKEEWVRLTYLGGARQVGRSCLFLQTPETRVLLDCGVNVAAQGQDAYPYLDAPEFKLEDLDAVIISHAHLDHCLPPHSSVLTDEGYKNIDSIHVGENIISMDWGSGKYVKSKCIEKTKTMGHKTIFTIKTPYSLIESSPNHRFFIIDNLMLKEVEASELKDGALLPSNILHKPKIKRDRLMLDINAAYDKRRKDHFVLPDELSPALAEFIGYYLGDGHKSSAFSLRLTDISPQILEYHKESIKNIFNYEGKIRHHSDKTKNAHILEINNVKIIRFLEKNFPEMFLKTKKIRAPKVIFESSPTVQRAFLRGFSDAEGTVTTLVRLTSFSDKMLRDLQHLFSLQGIPSTISSDHTISMSSKFSMTQFYMKIGFSILYKNKKLRNRLQDFSNLKFEKEDLMPVTPMDLRKILKEAGMFGRIHNSPILSKMLPMCLLDLLRRKKGYATRNTVMKLVKFLKRRVKSLEQIKDNSHPYILRQMLSLSRQETSVATGLTVSQVQQIEENRISAEFAAKISHILFVFIKEKLSAILSQTRHNISLLRSLLAMEVTWERISSIEEKENPYPYLVDLEVKNHNFVTGNIIVHNSGIVPFLFKMGYQGPVYCTAPTRDISALLALDFISVAFKQAKSGIFDVNDVKEMVKHTICLDYGEVTDITPDLRITFSNAGHIIGSSLVHLHVGNGLTNLLYTGDLKCIRTRLLDPAETRFPRLETVMLESTYGGKDNVLKSRHEAEENVIQVTRETLENGGKVLIPVLGVGRAQELILIMNEAMNSGKVPHCPIYAQGMVWDVTAIHTAYPDFLGRDVRNAIFHQAENPFLSKNLRRVGSKKEQDEVIKQDVPCIIIATSGMLTGGPSVEYFKQLCDNPKNTLLFVSYVGEGTLGRRIQEGERRIVMNDNERPEELNVKMRVHIESSLSGHAGRSELMRYVHHLQPRPKKILVNHGEASRCLDLASSIHKQNRIETFVPKNLETVRIR